MALDQTTTSLLVVLGIGLAGFLTAKIGSSVLIEFSKNKETISARHVRTIKIFRYLVSITAIIAALVYMGVDIGHGIVIADFLSKTYSLLPSILLAMLFIVLALAIINTIVFFLKKVFDISGVTEIMSEQNKEPLLNGMMIAARIALYFFSVLFLMNLFGMDISKITNAIGWLLYAIAGLALLYVFFGTRVFVENFIASIYLKASNSFKLGQKIKIDGMEGSIRSISNQGVTIKPESGYATFIPNREFVKKEISFRNIETDLDTLESIKSYYVEQKPSYCGPACASMALKIFGYNEPQSKIGELANTEIGTNAKGAGTKPDVLIDVVQKLTSNKVKGAWVNVEKITDLKSEARLWLNQGALLIVDYKKSFLFPEAKKAHYAVCVAVEGDELVILDPSGKKGGVYLADAEKLYRGMDTFSEYLQSKRGYIVLAPEGTTAYYRIEEGLIYSDPNLYEELSNKLKTELYRLTEKTELLETVLPLRVKNFIRKWREKDKIARLWKPVTVQ